MAVYFAYMNSANVQLVSAILAFRVAITTASLLSGMIVTYYYRLQFQLIGFLGIPLEDVQCRVGHAKPRTTGLSDRRRKTVARNIVDRISCKDRSYDVPSSAFMARATGPLTQRPCRQGGDFSPKRQSLFRRPIAARKRVRVIACMRCQLAHERLSS